LFLPQRFVCSNITKERNQWFGEIGYNQRSVRLQVEPEVAVKSG
jgi:hypothetical protein